MPLAAEHCSVQNDVPLWMIDAVELSLYALSSPAISGSRSQHSSIVREKNHEQEDEKVEEPGGLLKNMSCLGGRAVKDLP